MRAARHALLLLAFVFAGPLSYPQNPFTQREAQRPPPMYGARTPQFVRDWSRELQSSIADLSRRVRNGEWSAGLSAFFIAMLFGVVHIAGPGHGKVFALSYFAGRKARPREGLLYSAIVNAVDSLSAFVLVLLGYVVLRSILPTFSTDGPRYLQIAAYALIALFGVVHLLHHLRHGKQHDQRESGHLHLGWGRKSHGEAVETAPSWMLALSVGLVPCPVSTVLLVYGLANGVLPFMVLVVIGVSMGGFIAMSGISLAVIAGRERLLAKLETGAAGKVAAALEMVASVVIILAGAALLSSQL